MSIKKSSYKNTQNYLTFTVRYDIIQPESKKNKSPRKEGRK